MAARKGTHEDSKAIPAVAYMCGEERLLVTDAVDRLRARVLAEVSAPDFNHDRVSARGCPMGRLVDMCRTLPVMSARRLVEVRDAETIVAADHEVLLEYVRQPDPACTLLLVGEKADLRLKFFKELNSLGVLRIFSKLQERELPAWLHQRATRHGITLTDGAADSLAAAIGAELMLLERALEKLRLAAGSGGTVDEDHVATHVSQTRVETSFRIVDALTAGDLAGALQTLLEVVDAGEPPLRLLGALTYAQRNAIRFQQRLAQGASVPEAARECRIFFNANQVASRVKAAGAQGLCAQLVAMAEADLALKGGSVAEDESVLTALMFKLHALAGRPRAG